jgi:putative PIN family toxin of toxin-antitoxin system
MRALLDVNVLVSALLSPTGTPARLVLAWQAGDFELVVSPALLGELARALAYPKLRKHIIPEDAEAFVAWLSRSADLVGDPDIPPPARSVDPGDDYLIALAADQDAVLVSGDRHLLDLSAVLPIGDPAAFASRLAAREAG